MTSIDVNSMPEVSKCLRFTLSGNQLNRPRDSTNTLQLSLKQLDGISLGTLVFLVVSLLALVSEQMLYTQDQWNWVVAAIKLARSALRQPEILKLLSVRRS